MFYCNDCAKKNDWPETGMKSNGRCECCGESAVCNERSSSMLPLPKDNRIETPVQKFMSLLEEKGSILSNEFKEELLKAEKEAIVNAYNASSTGLLSETAEGYYNETFKK